MKKMQKMETLKDSHDLDANDTNDMADGGVAQPSREWSAQPKCAWAGLTNLHVATLVADHILNFQAAQ